MVVAILILLIILTPTIFTIMIMMDWVLRNAKDTKTKGKTKLRRAPLNLGHRQFAKLLA